MNVLGKPLLVLIISAMAAPAFAQVQTGSVLVRTRDAQGAVLPGATVTITSPVLVASMTGTTDAGGAYRAPSLPPGTYTIKVDLAGFQTLVREGIIVNVGQTTPLEIDLAVATVQESVTVAGQSPTVDTTTTNVSTTLNQQLLQSTPGGRDLWSIAEYKIPGLSTNRPDVGGNQGGLQAGMVARGTANGQNTQFLNGINVGDPAAIGYTQFYYDYDAFEEINVSVGSQDLSVPAGGVFFNMVTKSGTDQYHGKANLYWQGNETQSNNIDEDLQNQGLATTANDVDFVSDVNAQIGGPIVKNKLRFFGSFRDWRVHVNVPGFPEVEETNITSGLGNVAYQANDKNRFTGFISRQSYYKPNRGASAFNTPASVWKEDDTTSIYQGLWNSILSNNAFLDARVSYNDLFFPLYLKSTDVTVLDLDTNVRTGSNTNEWHFTRRRLQLNSSVSYYLDNLAGARHEFRFGADFAHAPTQSDNLRNGDINLFTRSGVPAFVNEYNTPVLSKSTVNTFALFGQDSVSFGRVTVSGGLRYQRTNGYLPDQSSPSGTFIGARSFDAIDKVISWNTVSPRGGVNVDVTGDGKTALKASAARYYYTISTGDPNIVNPNGLSFTQFTWIDANGDGQFQVGEEGSVVSRAGANISSIDPDLKQPYTNEFIVALEREVIPDLRVSIAGTWHYERNQYGRINTGVPSSSFIPTPIVDPGIDGLAGTGDDRPITVFNQDPATLGQDRLLYTNDRGLDQDYKGLEITANKRFSNNWLLLAAYTYGKTTQTNSYVGQYQQGNLNDPNTQINSDGATFYDRPHSFKLTGSYMLPYEVQVSGNARIQSGTAWSNNTMLPFRTLRVTLNQGSVNVFTNAPGDERTDAIKTIDLRAAKIFHFSRSRQIEGSIDVYNLFNVDTAFDINPLTGTSRVTNPATGAVNTLPTFGLPTGLVGPRIIRFGAVYRF